MDFVTTKISDSSADSLLRYLIASILFILGVVGGVLVDKTNYAANILVFSPVHLYGIYLCYYFIREEIWSPAVGTAFVLLNCVFFFQMVGKAEARWALSARNPALYVSLDGDVCIQRNILRSSQNGVLLAEPVLKVTEFRTWAQIRIIGRSPCSL